jgi:thioredoxin-like negative regulator of GroEL
MIMQTLMISMSMMSVLLGADAQGPAPIAPVSGDATSATTAFPATQVVMFFTMPNCPPCHAMRPHLNAFMRQYPGIKYAEIDITQHKDLAMKMGIRVTPTTVVIRDVPEQDPRAVSVAMGFLDAEKISNLITYGIEP